MAIKIDYQKCCFSDGKCTSCSCGGKCNGCVEACPTRALERKDVVVLKKELCIECGACIDSCPNGAVSFY